MGVGDRDVCRNAVCQRGRALRARVGERRDGETQRERHRPDLAGVREAGRRGFRVSPRCAQRPCVDERGRGDKPEIGEADRSECAAAGESRHRQLRVNRRRPLRPRVRQTCRQGLGAGGDGALASGVRDPGRCDGAGRRQGDGSEGACVREAGGTRCKLCRPKRPCVCEAGGLRLRIDFRRALRPRVRQTCRVDVSQRPDTKRALCARVSLPRGLRLSVNRRRARPARVGQPRRRKSPERRDNRCPLRPCVGEAGRLKTRIYLRCARPAGVRQTGGR
jgi:hypothetical protein